MAEAKTVQIRFVKSVFHGSHSRNVGDELDVLPEVADRLVRDSVAEIVDPTTAQAYAMHHAIKDGDLVGNIDRLSPLVAGASKPSAKVTVTPSSTVPAASKK